MKRNHNFNEEEMNRELFNLQMDDAWTEDMDFDDSYCDEKINQWLMEDFDEDDNFL